MNLFSFIYGIYSDSLVKLFVIFNCTEFLVYLPKHLMVFDNWAAIVYVEIHVIIYVYVLFLN